MTDAVKLLTEAEWREVLAHTDSDDDVIEALRERDHLAPEPTCPLLEEAREIAAKACEYNGHPETGEYMRSVDPANSTTLAAALAALKRGMEMRAPLTREMVREAVIGAKPNLLQAGDFRRECHIMAEAEAFIDRLHAALTKEQS